jgi:hypothetical protein
MKGKPKKSDAVAESRKWKEAVAKETEGMTHEETIACFDRAAVRRRFEAALRRAEQADKMTPKKARSERSMCRKLNSPTLGRASP